MLLLRDGHAVGVQAARQLALAVLHEAQHRWVWKSHKARAQATGSTCAAALQRRHANRSRHEGGEGGDVAACKS